MLGGAVAPLLTAINRRKSNVMKSIVAALFLTVIFGINLPVSLATGNTVDLASSSYSQCEGNCKSSFPLLNDQHLIIADACFDDCHRELSACMRECRPNDRECSSDCTQEFQACSRTCK